MVNERKYWCFISYTHGDNKAEGRQWATWLHQALETYEVPEELVGKLNLEGREIPSRIFPVFRDEEELSAGEALSDRIFSALDDSRTVIVLCSPRVVHSNYVDAEIRHFKKTGKHDSIFAAVIDGNPGSGLCFPEALAHRVNEEGEVIFSEPSDPLAADFRLDDGTQGWTSPEAYKQSLEQSSGLCKKEIQSLTEDYAKQLDNAKLQLISGILKVPLGKLAERDKAYQLAKEKQKAKVLRRWLSATAALFVVAAVAGAFALVNAHRTKKQRDATLTHQSRFLADLASNEIANGNAGNGLLLSLEALPDPEGEFRRPFVSEAAASLANAIHSLREIAVIPNVRSYTLDPQQGRLISVEGSETEAQPVVRSLIDGRVLFSLPIHQGSEVTTFYAIDGSIVSSEYREEENKVRVRIWSSDGGLKKDIGPVHDYALSDDQPMLITLTEPNLIVKWDVESGQETEPCRIKKGDSWGLELLRRSQIARVGDYYFELSSGNRYVPSEKEIEDFRKNKNDHYVWSPDRKRMVYGYSRRGNLTANLIDTSNSNVIADLSGPDEFPTGFATFGALFSNDGKMVVTHTPGNTATIWNGRTGEYIRTLKGHELPVTSLALSPGGRKILSASQDGSLRLWDLLSGEPVAVLRGHEKGFLEARFAADGNRIVSWNEFDPNRILRLWRASHLDSKINAPLREEHEVTSFSFSPDGNTLAAGTTEGGLYLFDIVKGTPPMIFDFNRGREAVARIKEMVEEEGEEGASPLVKVDGIEFSKDGSRFISATGLDAISTSMVSSLGHRLEVRNTVDGELIFSLDFQGSPGSYSFSSNLGLIVRDEKNGSLSIYDVEKKRRIKEIPLLSESARLSFSPDDKFFVMEDYEKIFIYQTDSWEMINSFSIDPGTEVSQLELHGFDSKGEWIIISHNSGFLKYDIRVINLSSGDSISLKSTISGNLRKAIFDSDSSFIATYHVRGSRTATTTFAIWDLKTGTLISQWEKDTNTESIELSHDGRFLLSREHQFGSGARFENLPMTIWHAKTGEQHFVIEGAVVDHIISPKGSLVAARLRNGEVQIWSLPIGKQIATFSSDDVAAKDFRFSPDGKFLAIAGGISQLSDRDSLGPHLNLYPVPTPNEKLIVTGRERAPRALTRDQRKRFFLESNPPQWTLDRGLWPYHAK